jgi:Tfp pilus assembly protein FimV
MGKTIISLILLLTPLSAALAAAPAKETPLNDTAPDRYIVVKDDTLWSIAGRFLPRVSHVRSRGLCSLVMQASRRVSVNDIVLNP